MSTDPRLQPVFLRDLDLEAILDILLGDVQILVYIDWDAFFQQARQIGISARWTTRQERKEITENYYQERAFRQDARIPVLEKDGREIRLMGGVVARIVTEGLSPLCLLEMLHMQLCGWDQSDVSRAAAKRTTGAEQNCTTGVMPDGHGLAGGAGGLAWSGAGAGLGRTLIGGRTVRRWR